MDASMSLAQSRLPTWRLILLLALPVLAQQSLVFAVMQSDRFLAGHLSSDGDQQPAFQAAQTTANYLAWLISSYTVTVTVGTIALVARFIGAGDRPLANQVMHQALLLASGLAIIGSVAALGGGLPALIDLLNLDGEAAALACNRSLCCSSSRCLNRRVLLAWWGPGTRGPDSG